MKAKAFQITRSTQARRGGFAQSNVQIVFLARGIHMHSQSGVPEILAAVPIAQVAP
jgi:hypothetical protein